MRASFERAGGGAWSLICVAVCLAWGDVASGQMVPVPDPEPAVQRQSLPQSPQRSIPPVGGVQAAPSAPDPAVATPAEAIAALPVAGTGRFALVLKDGTRLIGAPGDVQAVPFDAVFGRIQIPVAKIRTVEFVVEANGSKMHRVQFVNGDTLTGTVGPWEIVRFQTPYGELSVPLESMIRMSIDGVEPAPPQSPGTAKRSEANAAVVRASGRPVPVPIAEGPAAGPPRPLRPGPGLNADLR